LPNVFLGTLPPSSSKLSSSAFAGIVTDSEANALLTIGGTNSNGWTQAMLENDSDTLQGEA